MFYLIQGNSDVINYGDVIIDLDNVESIYLINDMKKDKNIYIVRVLMSSSDWNRMAFDTEAEAREAIKNILTKCNKGEYIDDILKNFRITKAGLFD